MYDDEDVQDSTSTPPPLPGDPDHGRERLSICAEEEQVSTYLVVGVKYYLSCHCHGHL